MSYEETRTEDLETQLLRVIAGGDSYVMIKVGEPRPDKPLSVQVVCGGLIQDAEDIKATLHLVLSQLPVS